MYSTRDNRTRLALASGSIVEEEGSDADAERLGEFLKMFERWITFAEFDFCEVGALNVSLLCEPLLGPTLAVAELPDAMAERDGSVVPGLRHPQMVGWRADGAYTLVVTIERASSS